MKEEEFKNYPDILCRRVGQPCCWICREIPSLVVCSVNNTFYINGSSSKLEQVFELNLPEKTFEFFIFNLDYFR